MKLHLLFLIALFYSLHAAGTNVAIINSQQGAAYAVQDTVWKFNAVEMGLNATIENQTLLSSISNLSDTDILIISSSTQAIQSQYMQTIKQFVQSGRPLYIQSEWIGTMPGNTVFDTLMDLVNVDFQWLGNTGGQLTPMVVSGSFATTPNQVSTLNFFNAGQFGNGTGLEKFLEFNGKFYGFCYNDPSGENGTIITTSDQDWIWRNQSPALVKNILQRMKSTITSRLKPEQKQQLTFQLYPNPATDRLTISELDPSALPIRLYSSSGKLIFQITNSSETEINLNVKELVGGLYFIQIKEKKFRFLKL